jgi:CheY-like chemotaxis protein
MANRRLHRLLSFTRLLTLPRELFAESLREAGFVVQKERLAEQALGTLTRERSDLILLDLGMPQI